MQHEEAIGPDCWKIIGGMGTAIIALCGAVVFLARGWLNAVLSQVNDRDRTISQMEAARNYSAKKGGTSP